eukprot:s200_g22.t1
MTRPHGLPSQIHFANCCCILFYAVVRSRKSSEHCPFTEWNLKVSAHLDADILRHGRQILCLCVGMNCTARRFVDLAVASVTKQLGLAGVKEDAIDSELSYHFDPGYSFGEPAGVEDCFEWL